MHAGKNTYQGQLMVVAPHLYNHIEWNSTSEEPVRPRERVDCCAWTSPSVCQAVNPEIRFQTSVRSGVLAHKIPPPCSRDSFTCAMSHLAYFSHGAVILYFSATVHGSERSCPVMMSCFTRCTCAYICPVLSAARAFTAASCAQTNQVKM